ncbi:MAG: winged helix-turn-helix domain-containing protein [Candidatus Caldatribacteriaceae bacterium]
MLESLITSKTRIRLLLKFFLDPENTSYLRELAEEFGESTNAVRMELNRMEGAGLLKSFENGRIKLYQANTDHPLFPEIHSMVRKFAGIDRLLEEVLQKLGSLEIAYITGSYAQGVDSGIIDLVLVGEIDEGYLRGLIRRVEHLIGRKIRYLVLQEDELEKFWESLRLDKALLLWERKKR